MQFTIISAKFHVVYGYCTKKKTMLLREMGAEMGAETEAETEDQLPKLIAPQAAARKYQYVPLNIILIAYLHLAALYGLYLACTVAMWKTLIYNNVVYVLATIGVGAGAHRLWTHKAYKAKFPLQVVLMLLNTMAYQNTALDWIKKHRMHHRYSDTDADPHNATRGFFFSHIGWLLVKRHPDVKLRERFVDMSDIYANPVLMFQYRYSVPMILVFCFTLPTVSAVCFLGESVNIAWHINILRYILNLHMSFFVNSAAHLWGNKPYDATIAPVQNIFVSAIALGEGFHNYHHTFPWDYRTAELGNNWLNVSAKFVDFCAWMGWAYDLKTVPANVVLARSQRTGDGSNAWGFKK